MLWILGILLLVGILFAYYGNVDRIEQEGRNKLINVSREELIEQIRQEEDANKIVDLCYQADSAWLLTDCPREMLCQGPRCLDVILKIIEEDRDKEKFDLLCETIEMRMESQGNVPEEWKSENCMVRFNY